jgi:hypothetical protein
MKQCPECRRFYYDDTLNFCLEDGTSLEDPLTSHEAPTALIDGYTADALADTVKKLKPSATLSRRPLRRPFAIGFVILALTLALGAGWAYNSYWIQTGPAVPAPSQPAPTITKVYWEMSEGEQFALIDERARYVQTLIGDESIALDADALGAIKMEIDRYLEDKDSLSQKPFEEAPRAVYGRASQFAPVIIRSYEAQKVPAALGLYQAVVESEYHDCLDFNSDHPGEGPVGLFQFSRKTAAVYGMKPVDYCDVAKQSDAAARYMSDLLSDFGAEKSSWTLALLSFDQGGEQVRDFLRRLRGLGITERSFWAIFRHQRDLRRGTNDEAPKYVPRFFAAAIIGETPSAFGLSTPPLSTLRN